MGGPFSGRWGWHRKKVRVDQCRVFDIAHLVGDKPPAAGYTGRFDWRGKDGTTVAASIRFTFVTAVHVRLDYRWGEAAEPVAVPFDLVPQPTPNGGVRYLARCPLTVNGVRCLRRTAKLYLPPGSKLFGCRVCHDLSYRSRQGHDKRVTALLKSDRLPELAADLSGHSVPTLGLLLAAVTEHDRRCERALRRLDKKPKPRRRKRL